MSLWKNDHSREHDLAEAVGPRKRKEDRRIKVISWVFQNFAPAKKQYQR